jgi:signal transduction histidine kinase
MGRRDVPRWRSVRARTTLLAFVLVAATLALASYLLLLTLERSLTANRDEVSRSLALNLADEAARGELPAAIPVGDDAMAQVVTAEGVVVAESSNLTGPGPVTRTAPSGAEPTLITLRGVQDDMDRETYRVWMVSSAGADGPLWVYVGASPERVTEAVHALRTGLLIGVPIVLALLAGATSMLAGRALNPVEAIRAEVAEISGSRLDRRVPVPDTRDEIERLAVTMNQMLARLDDSSRRQREFVADASHELLSPLASLRAQIEVAGANPDTTDWTALVDDLVADTDRMERLVRDLLFLAREDSAAQPVNGGPLDLDRVVLEEITRLRGRDGVVVDSTGVTPVPLIGLGEELGRMARNVIENARDHASRVVSVCLSASDDTVRLEIADDGPGIPEEDRDRVFERFVRVDPDRARRTDGGTGLGLPIALAIARRHGGDISVSDAGPGTRVTITLPRSPGF